MSFILDALKKSERERQRQSGPGLFEVKVAPPRNRFPMWVVLIGALLLVNVAVLTWLALHRASQGVAADANAAQAIKAAPVSAPVPTPQQPVENEQQTDQRSNADAGQNFGTPSSKPSSSAAADSRDASANETRAPDEDVLNPDDYEPAVEPSKRPRSTRPGAKGEPADQKSAAASKEARGLPRYQEAAAMPGLNLPELHLDLHVYDPEPPNRFVLINMQKLREGESFGRGLHVDHITPDGAVLSYSGIRFLLKQE